MKVIKYKINHPQEGRITNEILVKGRYIFIKKKVNDPLIPQMISSLKSNGASILSSRSGFRIDLFKDHEEVRMGDRVFNPREESDETLEGILYGFYINALTKNAILKKMGVELE